MSTRPFPRRAVASAALLVCLVFVAAGCEPLVNARPRRGDTVTRTFRYGPFTLGPGGEVQGRPHRACRVQPGRSD